MPRRSQAAQEYVERMTRLTGEYIDEFTTVPDLCSIEDRLSKGPECCKGHEFIPPKPIKLKPATKPKDRKPLVWVNGRMVFVKKDRERRGRDKQKHRKPE